MLRPHTLTRVREERAEAPCRDTHHREGAWTRGEMAAGSTCWNVALEDTLPHRPAPDSPFSLCWKEGENSLAVILAIRASSWAF